MLAPVLHVVFKWRPLMALTNTALLLIGFQNDYFAPDGILHSVLEDTEQLNKVRDNTLTLLDTIGTEFGRVISTPIIFSPGYEELTRPVGILKTIRDVGAFQFGSPGSETIPELAPYRDILEHIPGKRGLNAFSNTRLAQTLHNHAIDHLVLVGAVTSICIDSTARHAADMGLKVTVLSDCTTGRTRAEQDFYCQNVFPLYASVLTQEELIEAHPASNPAVRCSA